MSDGDDILPPPSGDAEPEPSPMDDAESPWWRRRVVGLPVWLLAGAGAAVLIGGAVILMSGGDDAPDEETIAPTLPSVVGPADVTDPTESTTPTTLAPATTAAATAATTAPPVTTAATEAPATTAPAVTTPPTTEPVATTEPVETTTPTPAPPPTAPATTAPPTTAAPPMISIDPAEPVTVEGPGGETLTVAGRRDACQRGPDCLVVGFEVTGLPARPPIRTFVCEFSSGARYTFHFSGDAVEDACATIDVPDSITVTVGQLRSATISIGD